MDEQKFPSFSGTYPINFWGGGKPMDVYWDLGLRNSYIFYPSELLGNTMVPLIAPQRKKLLKLSHPITYIGQETIVKKLKSTPGFEPHTDLISKLNFD